MDGILPDAQTDYRSDAGPGHDACGVGSLAHGVLAD
jgi:hypothetical protein